MSPLVKRFQLLLSVLSVLLLLAVAGGGLGWWLLRGSLAQLDGTRPVAGLGAPVRVERDALGVPLITAASRVDAARALGFLHAQERYFQMDLMRRRSAGELAELFGQAALPSDRELRVHGFRLVAAQVLERLPPLQRAVLDAYTAGVNAGLAALDCRPWEYLALQVAPVAWRAEDALLVVYSMWLDLQDSRGGYELSLRALRGSLGEAGLAFFAPRGNSWDAALDGSTFEPAPLPPLRLSRRDEAAAGTAPGAPLLASDLPRPGSNSFAVAGAHTASGGGMLQNDMHLDLRMPNTWYRASMAWQDSAGAHRLSGVTLPGTPALVAGSNGHIAWGFTNSYIDTHDIILVETDSVAQFMYRKTDGWYEIKERTEAIKVKGGDDETVVIRTTEWGPIIAGPERGRYYALRWTAHDPAATDFGLIDFETMQDVAGALARARRLAMPNQNFLVVDRAGDLGWTITGLVPRRQGYDGRVPVSWAYGDRYWSGYLNPEEIPVFTSLPEGTIPGARPLPEGLLWTANQRVVGGEAYARLGDGGYDEGARAGQIRDDLRDLVRAGRPLAPADLLGVALDDRSLFLGRWRDLLLEVLDDGAVARHPERARLRAAVLAGGDRATTDGAAHRLVRAFRQHTATRVLNPLLAGARESYPAFNPSRLMLEDAVWRLVQEKPVRLLNPEFPTWEALLLAAVDAVGADVDRAGLQPAEYTWGARNRLAMQHPFSRFLPGFLARLLDAPADPLPGDTNMPRVQGPAFGASQRMVVTPGREEEGLFHMPGGQSAHPLSPFHLAGHDAWVRGEATPLLPGPAAHTLTLLPP